jgi:hypothetical protein
MKKLMILVIALVLLTGNVMAHGIVSSTTIDAIGNFGTSSKILLRTETQLHPSDMLPQSDNELVYNEETFSNGMVPILFDKERTTFTDRFVIPGEDLPIDLNPDPRVIDADTESPYMDVLIQDGRADQTPDIGSAGTNFDTFRKSRNWIGTK